MTLRFTPTGPPALTQEMDVGGHIAQYISSNNIA
jgi:hypothetical protein